ncbi:class I SAM-dependent methyltransferase [Ktedonosporobacter rubrisoli]|nr:class I SAM-dependent methyltransferase [Ktedonosporobacter rubrisoli]
MAGIHPQENSYVIDKESATEMARLIDLDVMITRAMGGHFPPEIDLSKIHSILDVGCGPGGWATEVAFAHRDKQIVGVDISHAMLQYAREHARIQGLRNVAFRVMDATEKLDFPDESFDMVNARFMVSFMWKGAWTQFIQECKRITRPGGIIRLTDTDVPGVGSTNSAALDKLSVIMTRVYFITGRSFCQDEFGNHFGLTPMLSGFLKEAGYTNIRETPFMLNYSVGKPGYLGNTRNLEIAFLLLQQFLSKPGIATKEEIEQLNQQIQIDMRNKDFRGIWPFMSVIAQKPT